MPDDIDKQNEEIDQQIEHSSDEFDDFSFDDQNDDFNFDLEEPDIEGRKPASAVKKVASAAFDSFKQATVSQLGSEIALKMPKTASIYEEATSGIAAVKQLKDEFSREITPTINSLKSITNRLLPVTQKVIPAKLYQKIESWSKVEEGGGVRGAKTEEQLKEEQRQNVIEQGLVNIFGKQTETMIEEQKRESLIDRALEDVKHKDNISLLQAIRNHVAQLTAFSSSTFAAYIKKDLELKYRHLFIAQDTFNVLKGMSKIIEIKLEEIKHNTGLPDIQKTRKSEELRAELRQRTIGKFSDYVTDFGKNILGKVKENVLDKVKGGLEMLVSMGDALAMGTEMSQDMGMNIEDMAKEQMGGFLGGMAARPLTMMAASPLFKKLAPWIKDIENLSDNWKQKLVVKLNQWKEENEFAGGIKGMAASILPEFQRGMNIGNKVVEQMGQPAVFDQQVRLSIVEIIPGYLAKQTKLLTDIATGKQDNEELVYDVFSRKFIETSKLKENISEIAFGRKGERATRYGKIIGNISAAHMQTRGKKMETYEDFQKDIMQMINNMAYEKKDIVPKEFYAYVNEDESSPYIEKVMDGVKEPKKLARIIVSSIYDPEGNIVRPALGVINNAIREQMYYDEYREKLPEMLEMYGYRRHFSDIIDVEGNIAKQGIFNIQSMVDEKVLKESVESAQESAAREFKIYEENQKLKQQQIKEMKKSFNKAKKFVGEKVNIGKQVVQDKFTEFQESELGQELNKRYEQLKGKAVKTKKTLTEKYQELKDKDYKKLLQNHFDKIKSKFTKEEFEQYKAQILTKADELKTIITDKEQLQQFLNEYSTSAKKLYTEKKKAFKEQLDQLKKDHEEEINQVKQKYEEIKSSKPVQAVKETFESAKKQAVGIKQKIQEKGVGQVAKEQVSKIEQSEKFNKLKSEVNESKKTLSSMTVPKHAVDESKIAQDVSESVSSKIQSAFSDTLLTSLDVLFFEVKDKISEVTDTLNIFSDIVSNDVQNVVNTMNKNADRLIDSFKNKLSAVSVTEDSGDIKNKIDKNIETLEAIKNQLSEYTEYKKNIDSGIMTQLQTILSAISGGQSAKGSMVANLMKKSFKATGRIGSGIANMYTTIYSGALKGAGRAAQGAFDLTKSALPYISSGLGTLTSGLGTAASKAWDFYKDFYLGGAKAGAKAIWSGMKTAGGGLWSGVKGAGKAITGIFKKEKEEEPYINIYLKDKVDPGKPLLSKNKQEQGVVFANGELVEKSIDITKPVFDPETNECLITEDDIKHGLVDVNNKPLNKIKKETKKGESLLGGMFKGLGSFLGKGTMSMFDMYTNIWGGALKLGAKGVGKVWDTFFGKKDKDAEYKPILDKFDIVIGLLKSIDKHMTPQVVEGDIDQDGDREGSYQDYMQKLKERRKMRALQKAQQPKLLTTGAVVPYGKSQYPVQQEEGGGLIDMVEDVQDAYEYGKKGLKYLKRLKTKKGREALRRLAKRKLKNMPGGKHITKGLDKLVNIGSKVFDNKLMKKASGFISKFTNSKMLKKTSGLFKKIPFAKYVVPALATGGTAALALGTNSDVPQQTSTVEQALDIADDIDTAKDVVDVVNKAGSGGGKVAQWISKLKSGAGKVLDFGKTGISKVATKGAGLLEKFAPKLAAKAGQLGSKVTQWGSKAAGAVSGGAGSLLSKLGGALGLGMAGYGAVKGLTMDEKEKQKYIDNLAKEGQLERAFWTAIDPTRQGKIISTTAREATGLFGDWWDIFSKGRKVDEMQTKLDARRVDEMKKANVPMEEIGRYLEATDTAEKDKIYREIRKKYKLVHERIKKPTVAKDIKSGVKAMAEKTATKAQEKSEDILEEKKEKTSDNVIFSSTIFKKPFTITKEMMNRAAKVYKNAGFLNTLSFNDYIARLILRDLGHLSHIKRLKARILLKDFILTGKRHRPGIEKYLNMRDAILTGQPIKDQKAEEDKAISDEEKEIKKQDEQKKKEDKKVEQVVKKKVKEKKSFDEKAKDLWKEQYNKLKELGATEEELDKFGSTKGKYVDANRKYSELLNKLKDAVYTFKANGIHVVVTKQLVKDAVKERDEIDPNNITDADRYNVDDEVVNKIKDIYHKQLHDAVDIDKFNDVVDSAFLHPEMLGLQKQYEIYAKYRDMIMMGKDPDKKQTKKKSVKETLQEKLKGKSVKGKIKEKKTFSSKLYNAIKKHTLIGRISSFIGKIFGSDKDKKEEKKKESAVSKVIKKANEAIWTFSVNGVLISITPEILKKTISKDPTLVHKDGNFTQADIDMFNEYLIETLIEEYVSDDYSSISKRLLADGIENMIKHPAKFVQELPEYQAYVKARNNLLSGKTIDGKEPSIQEQLGKSPAAKEIQKKLGKGSIKGKIKKAVQSVKVAKDKESSLFEKQRKKLKQMGFSDEELEKFDALKGNYVGANKKYMELLNKDRDRKLKNDDMVVYQSPYGWNITLEDIKKAPIDPSLNQLLNTDIARNAAKRQAKDKEHEKELYNYIFMYLDQISTIFGQHQYHLYGKEDHRVMLIIKKIEEDKKKNPDKYKKYGKNVKEAKVKTDTQKMKKLAKGALTASAKLKKQKSFLEKSSDFVKKLLGIDTNEEQEEKISEQQKALQEKQLKRLKELGVSDEDLEVFKQMSFDSTYTNKMYSELLNKYKKKPAQLKKEKILAKDKISEKDNTESIEEVGKKQVEKLDNLNNGINKLNSFMEMLVNNTGHLSDIKKGLDENLKKPVKVEVKTTQPEYGPLREKKEHPPVEQPTGTERPAEVKPVIDVHKTL